MDPSGINLVIGSMLLQVQTSAAPCWAQLQAQCAKDLQNRISYIKVRHTHTCQSYDMMLMPDMGGKQICHLL